MFLSVCSVAVLVVLLSLRSGASGWSEQDKLISSFVPALRIMLLGSERNCTDPNKGRVLRPSLVFNVQYPVDFLSPMAYHTLIGYFADLSLARLTLSPLSLVYLDFMRNPLNILIERRFLHVLRILGYGFSSRS